MYAALLLTLALSGDVSTAPDVVVVCPFVLRPALEPWLEYRREQGHQIAVVEGAQAAERIRDEIRQHARGRRLRWVVLIGDAEPNAHLDLNVSARSTPTRHIDAKVNVKWGSEPEIATDNWYADLDDDGRPELAIGRLPADSPDELSIMIRKIIRYEQRGPTEFCRRINCVAGVGGFGAFADSILETVTKKFLTEGIPSSYVMSMTYGSWRSPYCPDPRRFRDAALSRLNEGCLFWVYIGHGQRTFLDFIRVPGGRYRILDKRDVPFFESERGAAIAVFLACYTGAFDLPEDCLAEDMLRAPGGPVAVYSGSRVTMPYAMAVMASGMLQQYFIHRRATLGETILHAKQSMVTEPDEEGRDLRSLNRQLLDVLATAISPSKDLLAEERMEHLALFNLLGDPLLRLPYPDAVSVETVDEIRAGETIEITGGVDRPGRCTVELVCRRDMTRKSLPARRQYDPSDMALADYTTTYNEANNRRWVVQSFDVDQPGPIRTKLEIPVQVRGPCHVRWTVEDADGRVSVGSSDVYVRAARTVQAVSSPGVDR